MKPSENGTPESMISVTGTAPEASCTWLKFKPAPNEPALLPVSTTRSASRKVGTMWPTNFCMFM